MNHIGVGVGYRPVHYSYLESSTPEGVDWFEIISENFMGVGGKPRQRLYNLRRNFPVAMHGVGLSIANTSPIDSLYLSQLKQLMDWLEPSLVTDHLVWTSHRKIQSYDLLPFPYTKLAQAYC
jgi:uncharacterized protein (UPF0276 family)